MSTSHWGGSLVTVSSGVISPTSSGVFTLCSWPCARESVLCHLAVELGHARTTLHLTASLGILFGDRLTVDTTLSSHRAGPASILEAGETEPNRPPGPFGTAACNQPRRPGWMILPLYSNRESARTPQERTWMRLPPYGRSVSMTCAASTVLETTNPHRGVDIRSISTSCGTRFGVLDRAGGSVLAKHRRESAAYLVSQLEDT